MFFELEGGYQINGYVCNIIGFDERILIGKLVRDFRGIIVEFRCD